MYRLLVVDDEANIRNVVREYAEFEEYEVTEAENGMEAVALCREQDFDPDYYGCYDAKIGRLFRLQGNQEAEKHSCHYAFRSWRRI